MSDDDAKIFGLPRVAAGDASEGREPLELLASEFIEQVRRGVRVPPEEYARRHPQLAAEILDLFPMLAAMEGWKVYRERTSWEHRSLTTLPNQQFGDFQFHREIGRGGMGIVFEASERSTNRRVAVKVLPFFPAGNWRARFEREAQIASGLQHAHIVPVHEYGTHEGLSYYSMRLIEGVGLDWVINRLVRAGGVTPVQIEAHFRRLEGEVSLESPTDYLGPAAPPASNAATFAQGVFRNSWSVMADLCAQAANALAYAHEHSTLHRDIKPGNLMVDVHGHVWVTDFGLAQTTEDVLSSEGVRVGGTLRYVAPEQFIGRVDTRSDIYSLGVTLFEMATRTPAFDVTDRTELIEAIRTSAVRRSIDANPRIPRDLDAVIARATAKDPDQRYATAAELEADLLRFRNGKAVRARGMAGWPRLRG